MKKLVLLSCIFFCFCAIKKENVTHSNHNMEQIEVLSFCPTDGSCSVKVEKDKQLSIKADAFGQYYTQLEDAIGTTVVTYQYTKNQDEELQDGRYTEEITFEIKNDTKELQLKDADLKDIKLLYARYCFCRGQTGQFPVQFGNFNYSKKNNQIKITLDFQNTKVPQIINKITLGNK